MATQIGRLKDDRNFPQYEDDDDQFEEYNGDELEELSLSFNDLDLDMDISYDEDEVDIDVPDEHLLPAMDGTMEPKLVEDFEMPKYILGTLMVRVVAARDLKPPRKTNAKAATISKFNNNSHNGNGSGANSHSKRRLFQKNLASSYAVLGFGDQIQRTSSIEEAINPSWTRTEPSLFFDITLPITNLIPARHEQPPKQILNLSMFHSEDVKSKNGKKVNKQRHEGVSADQDELVGMTSIDITQVLTGKSVCIDKWLPLDSTSPLDNASSSGSVRVMVEYECAEEEPRAGDKVRFTGFVDPTLCPVPRDQIFKVEEVLPADQVILSYVTPVERWRCRFLAHRFMLISVERHVGAMESLQEELNELTNHIAHSPAVEVVSETVKSLPQEGILAVGMQAAMGSVSLLQRWQKEGLGIVISDLVYAGNFDGKQTPEEDDSDNDSDDDDDDLSVSDRSLSGFDEDGLSVDSDGEISVASGMPCCPISGEPMRHPVVAADGHTYDRISIKKWLKRSNISPLTGTELKNKDLVPNYLLISTFGNKKSRNEEVSQV